MTEGTVSPAAVALSRQDLEAILDSLAEGIVLLDPQRRIAGINRAACEMLEIERAEALEGDCRRLFDEHFCAQAAAVRQSIETGRPVENVLSRLQTPGGQAKVLIFRTSVLGGDDRPSGGTLVVFRDVTELVQLRQAAASAVACATDTPPPTSERDRMERALQATGWNVAKAARRLGISRTTLYERIARYGLTRPED